MPDERRLRAGESSGGGGFSCSCRCPCWRRCWYSNSWPPLRRQLPGVAVAADLIRPVVAAPPSVPFGARAWIAATVSASVAAAVAAILLAPPASARPPEALAFLLFVGSSVHVASTSWFYTVPEARAHMRQHKARFAWGPLALIAGAGAIAALVPRVALNWLLLPYFAWQFFHYQKQNLGIAALAATSRQVTPLRRTERRSLIGAGLAGIAGLLARPSLLQVPVRAILAPTFGVAAIAFAAFAAIGV